MIKKIALVLGLFAALIGQAVAQGGMMPGPGTAHSTGFTPASLTGLIGWYDASVASSMRHTGAQATNGQTVDQWNDQSVAGNDLTTVTAAPTLNTTGFNTSYPTVVFDNTGNTGLGKSSYAIGTGTTLCAFVVAQMNTGVVSYARLLSYVKPSASDSFANPGSAAILIRDSGNNSVESYADSHVGTAASLALDTPAIFGAIFNGANFRMYMNNVAGGTTTHSTSWVSAGDLTLGTDVGAARWKGPVSEVIIATGDCTANATNIYNYLKAKWGL